MKISNIGMSTAKILIVGDVGANSDYAAGPLSGSTGDEFTRMLHEADIIRTECFITLVYPHLANPNDLAKFFSVFNKQKIVEKCVPSPELLSYQKELYSTIDRIKPNVIIALGELPLYVLTKNMSITKWRGSILETTDTIGGRKYKVIPTFHPRQIMTVWSRRYQSVNDLKRASYESSFPEVNRPDYLFHLEPTRDQVFDYLIGIAADLDLGKVMRLSSDIETINRHISCHGIAISSREAMCIPFISRNKMDGYFSQEDELEIIKLHKYIFTHQNARIIGQNWLYDVQFFARYWGFYTTPWMDTMIGWHSLFPGEPKSLDFLSSMLCGFHEYWKDDVKDYSKYPADEHQYWKYNAKDCVITYEVAQNIEQLISFFKMEDQYNFLMSLFPTVLRMMMRGTRIDTEYKNKMAMELWDAMTRHENWFLEMVDWREQNKGQKPWYRSPKQLAEVLYHDLGAPVQRNKKTKGVTTEDKALEVIKNKEPVLKPLVTKLQEYRSLGIFRSNFAEAGLDADKRIRCSYGIAGPETFRFNSKISVFGTGANLQTIPKGNKLEDE